MSGTRSSHNFYITNFSKLNKDRVSDFENVSYSYIWMLLKLVKVYGLSSD